MTGLQRRASAASLRGLDWTNVFLADVQTGIGPFLAMFLTTTRHWDPARVGFIISLQALVTTLAQPIAGVWVDTSRRKRWLIVGASVVIAVSSVALVIAPGLLPEVFVQVPIGGAVALFPPTIAAMSLGLVGHRALPARVGRNEGFNHAGNVGFALLAGVVGTIGSPAHIFYGVAVLAAGSIVAALSIRPDDIDDELARGGSGLVDGSAGASWRDVVGDRRILVFATAVLLFHLANAAMLPLVGELLSTGQDHAAPFYMCACIVVAQTLMVPVALVTGRLAERWGRKPVFQIAFAVLALRGVLYTLGSGSIYLIAVQSLDGVGAAIFGVLWVVILSDLTRGTGRFNAVQGCIQACLGAGAFLSLFLSGLVVAHAGFATGFLLLSGVALVGLTFFSMAMPETKPSAEEDIAQRHS